jgi:hypothetical protein
MNFITAPGETFLLVDPAHEQRRQQVVDTLLKLRQLSASHFTVEEIGLLLLTNALFLTDDIMTRIEAMGQREIF